jgi:hypothetical protein
MIRAWLRSTYTRATLGAALQRRRGGRCWDLQIHHTKGTIREADHELPRSIMFCRPFLDRILSGLHRISVPLWCWSPALDGWEMTLVSVRDCKKAYLRRLHWSVIRWLFRCSWSWWVTYFGFLPPTDEVLALAVGLLIIRDGRRGGGGGAGGCKSEIGKRSNLMKKHPHQQMSILEFLDVIIRIMCCVRSHTFGALVFKFPVCKAAVLFEVDTRDCTVAWIPYKKVGKSC